MPETINKLRPDRDLQCYFQRPSAIATLSETSSEGFTVSGCWRQQFDWAVVEWNRDNVFEHPSLRTLPDGDLSGILLSYQEQRINCISADSTLFATVDWPYLRIWADPGSGERVYKIPLRQHAVPVDDSAQPATAVFTLSGTPTPGDLIELAWDAEHYNYTISTRDSLEVAAAALAADIEAGSSIVSASASGCSITLTVRAGATAYAGANGNRLGAYATSSGAGNTETWSPLAQQFSAGASPTQWAFSLDFSNLLDVDGQRVPTNNVRKMRWTYAAALQNAAFVRSEFSVTVSNWVVSGSGLAYSFAGPGSRRIEDTDPALTYSTGWSSSPGNFSGGTIHFTTTGLTKCDCVFSAERQFQLYIGSRLASNGASLTVTLDGVTTLSTNLAYPLEDVLVRLHAGAVLPGVHSLTIQHTGQTGTYLYFDFLELVVPTQTLPDVNPSPNTTLATDWDTDHSIALAPERTAWLIHKLGFNGRANHYCGALWFYEMVRSGHVYATCSIQFGGSSDANSITTISLGLAGSGQDPNVINHLHLAGDSPESVAKAFELRLNSGYTSVWAESVGATLNIQARIMGAEGNNITIAVSTNSSNLTVVASGSQLNGGFNGDLGGVSDLPDNQGWRTDLTAFPRINRGCRDWSRSFFRALRSYGIEATAAFSMELQHGDLSTTTGIVQRYPSGNPVILSTPAMQSNFSPASQAFWQQVYADMAQVMTESGQTPYLQFGEVQWWYFSYDGSGLPFYDAYTTSQFAATYGRAMAAITSNLLQPKDYPQEAAFLASLVGSFTRAIMLFVRQTQPATRFEVLYPPDTNAFPFTGAVNLPANDWTTSTLDCFKTENFTYTGARDLTLAAQSIDLPKQLGFPVSKSSHLVGISGVDEPWQKEANAAIGAGVESVVLFALDQYCLIGYSAQSSNTGGRSFMLP